MLPFALFLAMASPSPVVANPAAQTPPTKPTKPAPGQTQGAVQLSPVVPAKYRAKTPKPTTVVAKVNGMPIRAADVEALLWEWRGPEVTEDLISLLMVREAAAKQGITVTQQDIEVKLLANLALAEQQKKMNQRDPNPGMSAKEALALQGYPSARLYVRSEIETTIEKIALKRFNPSHFVKISTIIFRIGTQPVNPGQPAPPQTAAAESDAVKKAQAAYERLKKGDAWDKVLQDSGADQRTLSEKGLLGWRAVSAFPAELQKVIVQLKPGSFTEPYRLPVGFQIFRVESQGSNATPADLKDLRDQFVARERENVVNELRQGAKIERYPPKEPAAAPAKAK